MQKENDTVRAGAICGLSTPYVTSRYGRTAFPMQNVGGNSEGFLHLERYFYDPTDYRLHGLTHQRRSKAEQSGAVCGKV